MNTKFKSIVTGAILEPNSEMVAEQLRKNPSFVVYDSQEAAQGDEKPLKIFIFRPEDESYHQLCVIESSGTAIDSVYYQDLNGDGRRELIVGWRISAEVQTVAVYTVAREPVALMSSGYTRFTIQDLNGDGIPSLLVLRTDADSRSILPANLQKLRKFLPQDFQFSCILLIGIGQLLKSGPFIRKISRIYPHLFHITGGNRSSLSNKMNIRRNRSRISPFTQTTVYFPEHLRFLHSRSSNPHQPATGLDNPDRLFDTSIHLPGRRIQHRLNQHRFFR